MNSLDEIVKNWFTADRSMIALYHFPTQDNLCRVVSVDKHTPAMGIIPIYLGQVEEGLDPIVMIEVTPQEWDSVRQAELTLPKDWDLSTAVEYTRYSVLGDHPVQDERAMIVAWLRAHPDMTPNELADSIENGEHDK